MASKQLKETLAGSVFILRVQFDRSKGSENTQDAFIIKFKIQKQIL